MEGEHKNFDLSGSIDRSSGTSAMTFQLRISIVFDEKLNVVIETTTNENKEKEPNPSSGKKLAIEKVIKIDICSESCFNEFDMRKAEERLTLNINLLLNSIFPTITGLLNKENKMIFEVVIKQETRQKTIEILKTSQNISEEKERDINMFFEKLERFVKESMEENIKTFDMQRTKQYEIEKFSKRVKSCQLNQESKNEMKKEAEGKIEKIKTESKKEMNEKQEERVNMGRQKEENNDEMKKKQEKPV